MSKTLKLDYFYGMEAEQYTFYRIPKILFTDENFKGLSVDAKMLYGLMLERMGLSIKNGWIDRERRVFIYFTLEDAMEILGCAHTKAIKIFCELDTLKGVGLIERRKQGQGKPAIIYVKSFGSMDKNKKAISNEQKKAYENSVFKTCENKKAEHKEIYENIEFFHENEGLEEDENGFDCGVKTVISQNGHSEVLEFRNQELLKTDTNNTDINNTNINNNQSINLSIPKDEKNKKDGLMDRISKEDLENLVLEELYSKKTLPYEYIADERKMTIAIHTFTDYEVMKENVSKDDSFYFLVFKIFNEALIEMLTSTKPMTLKGADVTYEKVYDKLLSYISFETVYGNINGLQEIAIGDFMKACKEQNIKNHFTYMKACIWNAMQVGDIGIQALISRDFG
ncbi:MAG: replication initiator protein A [Anaerotignaceae bacterium]